MDINSNFNKPFSLIDIDECIINGGTGPCENGATCMNTAGSYACTCADGWQGDLCQGSVHIYVVNDFIINIVIPKRLTPFCTLR